MTLQMGIFPLPGLILFPGTYLPLHIFEPRYRLMLEYCVESDYEIGISSLNYSNEIDHQFGWGKIIRRDFLPDGRSNIIIEGTGIVKIESYESDDPFIIANVNKISVEGNDSQDINFQSIVKKILDLTKSYLHKAGVEHSFIDEIDRIITHKYPIDFIASILNISFEEKRSILLTLDKQEKGKILLNILNRINQK